MPLFKVQDVGRSKKVTVCAATLVDLISSSVKKLDLELKDVSLYRVYDDSDGTLIDDDECLASLNDFCVGKGQHLTLTVQLADIPWSKAGSEPPLPPTPPLTPVRQNPEANVDPGTSSTPDASAIPAMPYRDFCSKLKQAADSPQHSRHKALCRARRFVANGIGDRLKNKRLPVGVVKQICILVRAQCPQAFTMEIKGSPTCCFAAFVKAVYNAIGYAREAAGLTARKRRQGDSTVEDDVDNPAETVPHLCVDSNGCEEGKWEPFISDDDVAALEIIRTTLMTYPPTEPHAAELVKQSFQLQRHHINRARTHSDWKKVFEDWPILQWQDLYLTHCNLLMGKCTQHVWTTELAASLVIKDFFVNYIAHKENVSKREKNIRDWLSKADEACETLSSVMPHTIGMFLCIVEFFGERVSNFFLILSAEESRTEILRLSSEVSQCPLLIVQGSSIFAPDSRIFVAVRGLFLIRCHDVVHGILVMLLGYFIFNISYPKVLSRTLEFLQRYILLVNPATRPTRRDGKSNKINASVASFSGLLADFEATQSRWQ